MVWISVFAFSLITYLQQPTTAHGKNLWFSFIIGGRADAKNK